MGTGDFEGPVSPLRSRTAPPFLPLVGLAQEGPLPAETGRPRRCLQSQPGQHSRVLCVGLGLGDAPACPACSHGDLSLVGRAGPPAKGPLPTSWGAGGREGEAPRTGGRLLALSPCHSLWRFLLRCPRPHPAWGLLSDKSECTASTILITVSSPGSRPRRPAAGPA